MTIWPGALPSLEDEPMQSTSRRQSWLLSLGFLPACATLLVTYPMHTALASLWGDTDFGMPLAAFRSAYPTAKPVTANGGDATVPFVSYRLTDQVFGDFKGCELEFSFTGADPQLYRLQVHCPSDAEAVHRYLTSRYGNPTAVNQAMLVWRKQAIEVTFAPKSGVVTISDAERSKAVAAALMQMLRQVPVGPPKQPASSGQPH